MRETTACKKIISVLISVFLLVSMSLNMTCGAVTYCILYYKVGEADNVVGASEVHFDKVINTTFDVANESRFSRKGYTIESWYIPSTGETVSPGSQYRMPDHDITFIANWKPASYQVSFAGKGGKTEQGESNISSQAVFGTDMILPECQFNYDGYEFAGWKYDGTVYEAGQQFTVPALLSGSKIVFAAVWELNGSAPVTTVPDATEPETTAATEVQDENMTEYPVNAALDFNNDENKMYQIPLDEILSRGIVDELKINFSSDSETVGEVILGIGTNVASEWFSFDFHEYIDEKNFTIDFANSEVCNCMNGEYLQIGYWWGTAEPLKIDSLTVKYNHGIVQETTVFDYMDAEETTVKTTTTTTAVMTTTTTTTTKTTTTTTTTTITTTVTTTTTTEAVTESEESETEESTTEETTVSETAATEKITATTVIIPDSQYSKAVDFDETAEKNSSIYLSYDELAGINQIIESIEFTFRADDVPENYSLAVSVADRNGEYSRFVYEGLCRDYELNAAVVIPVESQEYISSDDFIIIDYLEGDSESITLESVKVNYRIDVGDYNGDGVVSEDDIDALRKYMVGVSIDGYELNAESADVNGDGAVDVFDCMMLARRMY